MNSQEAITALQALRSGLVDELQGRQAKIDALDVAFKLLNDGYEIDQDRIDTDVQKAKDEVESDMASLTDERDELHADKEALEKQVAELLTQVDDLTPKDEDEIVNP